MQITNCRILKEDLQRVNELAERNNKSQWQVIHNILTDINEVKAESQKVINDKQLKNCLYDRYEYQEGKITYECPILQKLPEPITTLEEGQKKLLPYCKVCKRYQIMLMKLKNYYQPQKTSAYKKQYNEFGDTSQEPTWQHNTRSGDFNPFTDYKG